MKTILVVLAVLIVVAILIGLQSRSPMQTVDNAAPKTQPASQPSHEQSHTRDYAVKGRVPAYYTTAPDLASLGPTLSPELFTGNKKLAYQAAKQIPQTLAQLPCYCHCDKGHNHKSLHSCFESEHGENCGICIGEALMAYNLQKQGAAVGEIRKKIIAAYGAP